jgi:alpha-1,6-mannosyltransferase
MSKKLFIFAILFSSFFSLLYLIQPKNQSSADIVYLFIVAFLLFLIFIYFAFSLFTKDYSFKEIFVYSIFLHLLLVFVSPITSSDLYSYIYQSRIWTVFKASPYLFTYSQFPQDVYFDILNNSWANRTSPYGPLMILIKSFFTYIFSFNIWVNIYVLKLFFILINLVNAYLIYKISQSKLALYLYAFNPLIIFEIAINGHNDGLFICFLLLSIYFFLKEKSKSKFISYLFLCFSVFTKFISLLFLPIFILFNLLSLKTWKSRIKLLLFYIIIFSVLAFIFYFPFVSTFSEALLPLVDQMSYHTAASSPVILLLFSAFSLLDKYDLFYLILATNIARFIFLAYYIYTIYSLSRAKEDNLALVKKYVYVLLAFFACFFTFILPWYLLSLMAIALLLLKKQTLRRPALLIFYISTVYAIMQYILLR